MLKTLFATLLMIAPLSFGSFTHENNQKTEEIHEIYIKRSAESDDFLTYWKEDFRKDNEGEIIPICDITYTRYKEMYSRYVELSTSDKNVVDSTPDYEQGYTIKDSIKELIRIHSNKGDNRSSDKRVLNQSSTIIIIVVIAVFGMSTICVFFVLKNNKIIQ